MQAAIAEARANAEAVAYRDFTTKPNWFHEGQSLAWSITGHRVICVLAGKQGGKSTFGLEWFLREIQLRGPGDYCVGGPSYVVLNKRALPDLKARLVESGFATYNDQKHEFRFTETGIAAFFGATDHATLYEQFKYHDSDSGLTERPDEFRVQVTIHVIEASVPGKLEAGTYKGAWVDEAGNTEIPEQSYDNLVNGRLVRYRARCCMTTTPYDINWLKTRVHDTCEEAPKIDGVSEFLVGTTGVEVCVRFESWMNPVFGRVEFDRIRDSGMPEWYFDMMYRARFTRPHGTVFDCWSDAVNTIPNLHHIPPSWLRIWGTDFGTLNFAAVKVAIDPDNVRAIVYQTYHPKQSLNTSEHVEALYRGEPLLQTGRKMPLCRGGKAHGENDWRRHFGTHGLVILPPLQDNPDSRIQTLYSLLASGRLVIMDGLTLMRKEITGYKRKVDDSGNVTAEIEKKSQYHRLDSLMAIALDIERAIQAAANEKIKQSAARR